MWVALDSYRDISAHLSALLGRLEEDAQALVHEIPPPTKPTTTTTPTTTNVIKNGSASSNKIVGVGKDFWSGVMSEITMLHQKLAEVQRASRSAYMSRLMVPPGSKPFMRKPHDVMTTRLVLPPESIEAREMAARFIVVEENDEEECSGINSSSTDEEQNGQLQLDGMRLGQLNHDLRQLWAQIGVVMRLLRKCDDGYSGGAPGTKEGNLLSSALEGLSDQAKRLCLDLGDIGVLLPSPPRQAVWWDEGERRISSALSSLTERGLRPFELARRVAEVDDMIRQDRRTLGGALALCTDELMSWRCSNRKQVMLVHKLSVGIQELWKGQTKEMQDVVGGIKEILNAYEDLEEQEDVARLVKAGSSLSPSLAAFLRTFREYREEVMAAADIGEGTRGSRVKHLETQLRGVWSQYESAWRDLKARG